MDERRAGWAALESTVTVVGWNFLMIRIGIPGILAFYFLVLKACGIFPLE
jgi:hypothetical protein